MGKIHELLGFRAQGTVSRVLSLDLPSVCSTTSSSTNPTYRPLVIGLALQPVELETFTRCLLVAKLNDYIAQIIDALIKMSSKEKLFALYQFCPSALIDSWLYFGDPAPLYLCLLNIATYISLAFLGALIFKRSVTQLYSAE